MVPFKKKNRYWVNKYLFFSFYGAGYEIWTRDFHLGKVTLYRWVKPACWCPEAESNHRHGDFQSPALPTELSGRKKRSNNPVDKALKNWRPGRGSNPRPLAWQASVLTNWTTGPFWWELQGSNLWPPACKADALPAELNSQKPIFRHRRYEPESLCKWSCVSLASDYWSIQY